MIWIVWSIMTRVTTENNLGWVGLDDRRQGNIGYAIYSYYKTIVNNSFPVWFFLNQDANYSQLLAREYGNNSSLGTWVPVLTVELKRKWSQGLFGRWFPKAKLSIGTPSLYLFFVCFVPEISCIWILFHITHMEKLLLSNHLFVHHHPFKFF